MESLGGFRDRFLVFASFLSVICVVTNSEPFWPFGSSPGQLFRQSNLNSKLNLARSPLLFQNFPSMICTYIMCIR